MNGMRIGLLKKLRIPDGLFRSSPPEIANQAGMAELVDAPDLGSGAARRAGSSPVPGTFYSSASGSIAAGQSE